MSLGKIDKNLIPILIGSVICFLDRLLSHYEGIVLYDHTILLNIFVSFFFLFAIIPFIILKNKTKNLQEKKMKEKNIKKNWNIYI